MTVRFDHAIILVYDLETASAAYQKAGFTVIYGGQHAGGKTHNGLIVFRDKTYLELLAPTDPALLHSIDPSDRSNFLFWFQQGEGFGGYALQSDQLEADAAALRACGLKVELRPPGGRVRPDGQPLRWQTAILTGMATPFLIQDITPRHLRVPDDDGVATHSNGALGVAHITLQASPLQWRLYESITGSDPDSRESTFRLGDVKIRLEKTPPGNTDRLREIVLRTDGAGTSEITASKGARIQLVGKRQGGHTGPPLLSVLLFLHD